MKTLQGALEGRQLDPGQPEGQRRKHHQHQDKHNGGRQGLAHRTGKDGNAALRCYVSLWK